MCLIDHELQRNFFFLYICIWYISEIVHESVEIVHESVKIVHESVEIVYKMRKLCMNCNQGSIWDVSLVNMII